ncbi:hypothetical protein [Pedobacter psychroterrae]|uniref:Lipocalin-like protein n=1 Tax=Pedobacter psychroterrae TaxID=2530453 RepID=A0A4R0NL71_9SPHI|nr:hypothetical protein [Pedobacter psychroterrae]TCD00054.1 hypothetical protein EZ437_15150 [Pedobacter psychroterrae]
MKKVLYVIFCSILSFGCGFGIDTPKPTYIGIWNSKNPEMHLDIKNIDGYGDSVTYKVSKIEGVDYLTISDNGTVSSFKVQRLLGTTLFLKGQNGKSIILLKTFKSSWRY